MTLTTYVRNLLKPSPSEYRQCIDAVRALAAGPEEPSIEVVQAAQSVINKLLRRITSSKSFYLDVMQVPNSDFIFTPSIYAGSPPRSNLKNNTVAAVVYDFCAEAGLHPYLRPWTTFRSGTALSLAMQPLQ